MQSRVTLDGMRCQMTSALRVSGMRISLAPLAKADNEALGASQGIFLRTYSWLWADEDSEPPKAAGGGVRNRDMHVI